MIPRGIRSRRSFQDIFTPPTSPVVNPATKALSGWWRAPFAGSPLAAVASAGTSGANGNLAEATNPPAIGAALNGKAPMDFDGTNDQISNSTAISTFLSDAAGSIAILFYANSVAADPGGGSFYLAEALFSDSANGFTALTITDAGVRMGSFAGGWDGPVVAASTGAWHLAVARWNATDIQVGIDGGSFVNMVRTTTLAADTIVVGKNYDVAFFDGDIAEVMLAQYRFSDQDVTDLVGYVNDRYGLSL